jgi:hypothetical protein
MMGEARRRSLCVLAAVVSGLLLGGQVLGQGGGEIEGHVQDAQGQPLQGVGISLLKAGNEASRQQTSDAQGNFRFAGLESGVYIAAASLEGYGSVTCPGVRIIASLSRRLELKMLPAEGEESASSCHVAAEPGR